jgi:hypothetical protein
VGIATASANFLRSLGGSIATAGFGAVFAAHSVQTVFLVAAPVAIAGLLLGRGAARRPDNRERSLTMASVRNLRTNVLLRSDQSGGHFSMIENVIPGFERHFGRIAAASQGVEPPDWALQPIPEVIRLGPQMAWDE